MKITESQINRLKESYKDNRDSLEELDRFITRHGMTNEGLLDITESFEQGYNNALEFVFNVLNIEYIEKKYVDKAINSDYDFEEICGNCDYVNEVKWDGKSRSIICKGCGEEILLCSLCDWDNCNCDECPY